MKKRVVITERNGRVTEIVVSSDETAREYEDLVLVPGGSVVKVVVTDA